MNTLYINDLPSATKLQVRLFADDTNITASHHQKDCLEKTVNEELINISNWMKINKPSINYKKSKYIIMTNKKKPKSNLKINTKTIEQDTCANCLGVLIDHSLNWKPQIHKVSSKLASGCWALYHLQKYVDCKTLKGHSGHFCLKFFFFKTIVKQLRQFFRIFSHQF